SGVGQPGRNATLGFTERHSRCSMRFAFQSGLIQHEILKVQNAELFQSALTLSSVGSFSQFRFRLRNQPLEIGSNNQTRSLLINLSYAVVKCCSGEAACLTLLNNRRQILKLIELGTRSKQILLNPDIKLFCLF